MLYATTLCAQSTPFNCDVEANSTVHLLIHQPRQLDIVSLPIPQITPDQVLLKGMSPASIPECIMTNRTPLAREIVTCCGICGTDQHLAEVRTQNAFHRADPQSDI